MNNKDYLLQQLRLMQLSTDEAKLYLELLKEPSTHAHVSKSAGVNRTKVYRLVESLEKKSLVARRTDDTGTYLVAADPATLEVALVTREETIKQQRAALATLVPSLSMLQQQDSRAFMVRTYENYEGLRQMLWHELKTKGDLVAFGNGTIEQQAGDLRWANKHRDRQIAAGYRSRDLINYTYDDEALPDLAGEKLLDSGLYDYRIISPEIITFDSQTIVYDDTVAIYHWKYDQKVGVEIISPTYANMMRGLFEHFWNIADRAK